MLARTDGDALAAVGVLERVLNQVAEDLVHGVRIGHARSTSGRARGFEDNVGIHHDAAQALDRILNE